VLGSDLLLSTQRVGLFASPGVNVFLDSDEAHLQPFNVLRQLTDLRFN
jgi:hypothetical protein